MSDEKQIQHGTEVVITDAWGDHHRVRAVSPIQPGRDFLVVWVEFDDGARMPWPAEHVDVLRDSDA